MYVYHNILCHTVYPILRKYHELILNVLSTFV